MRLIKAVVFTFWIILFFATLQNGMTRLVECNTDTFTIYKEFLSEAANVSKMRIY